MYILRVIEKATFCVFNSEKNGGKGMKKLMLLLCIASMAIIPTFPLVSSADIVEKVKVTKGQEMARVLSGTNWHGTKVYDKNKNDLTRENANFIGLAKYDNETSRYEFFDKTTKQSRGDYGTFFITNDGKIRVLIS